MSIEQVNDLQLILELLRLLLLLKDHVFERTTYYIYSLQRLIFVFEHT